jgi:type V secretory pathway adhesin AidA
VPLLTGNDQITLDAFATTLTNKTLNTDENVIKHSTTNNAGDILVNTGTKFDRFARGTGLQVLQMNSGATAAQWATISSYTEAKGSTTKNGDASTVAFTQAHGLGGTPTYYGVSPTSTDADGDFYLTADGTNLTITYPFPPPTGTSNLTYVWRAAL